MNMFMEQPEFIEVDDTLGDKNASQSEHGISISIGTENQERTYHTLNDGKYLLPNDEVREATPPSLVAEAATAKSSDESDGHQRLDTQHQIQKFILDGKLQLSPIPDSFSGNVLDLGTGTGIWATEFASRYPSSTVLGVDLSPINPTFTPPNCSFRNEDYEEEWKYPAPFSLIYGRALVSCLKDPRQTFATAYKHLTPGGWLELNDPIFPFKSQDGSLEEKGKPLLQWSEEAQAGSAKLGRPFADVSKYPAIMEEVGFVNVTQRMIKVPLSDWPKDKRLKEVGAMNMRHMLNTVGALKKIWTAGLGYSAEDADAFMEKVRSVLIDRKVHAFAVITVVYGQKPNEVQS
ncbi:hypothetical protein BP6252_01073 [Coleophoma cylindrospora]|uniref:S-adenosyl-L-methionine-dependent methyltransferase n=1 Tax=Coleophoma cylindrospora TaxID=1849047 RepID=A0A3D8SS86_9HELO|nr:hypothetical protein BP6252_01073 [Coleophoma cylindrospora]